MAERLIGELESVVFRNPGNGWTVARMRAADQPGMTTIIGLLPEVSPGEGLILDGTWKEHPKFGRQFEVEKFEQAMPATERGVVKYLASPAVPGVGEVIAKRLVDRFGKEVLDVLDTDPDKLLSVKGITKKKLADIVEAWDKQREIKNLILFLHTHQVPPTYAARIFELHGAQSVAKLTSNPYELAYEIRGIGFRTADNMALKLGFAADAPERVEAAVVFSLFTQAERNGHLYLPRPKLTDEVLKLLGGDMDPGVVDQALEVLEVKKRVHLEAVGPDDDEAAYLMHFYRYEQETARRLQAMISHPTPVTRAKVEKALPEVESRVGITLTDEQREAVFAACVNKVFVITGGPGTGKTTITRAVVQTLSELGLKLKLAAPTGRAAKRLSEATGHPAQTLHRLLQFTPDGSFTFGEDKKLKAEVLIVDEASMLDAHLFVSLLRAMPLTSRLILVGDVNQLPSVGPGNVLADVLNSGTVPRAVLTHIFRQAQESCIVVNAHRINQGQFPVQSPHQPPRADFFWIEQDDPARVQAAIVETVCGRIPERYGLNPLRDVQVLTPMHRGEAGTQTLNKLLQERLNPRPPLARNVEIKRGHTTFRTGDRVLQLRNNYDKEVFNGDLGWITEVDEEAGEMAVEFDTGLVHLESSELDDLALAYAVSVHKSQGSEYPAVVVPVMTQHYVLLQRNLLYTALTRARKLAVMIGSVRAFQIGLDNVTAGRRYTALARRLAEAFDQKSLLDS